MGFCQIVAASSVSISMSKIKSAFNFFRLHTIDANSVCAATITIKTAACNVILGLVGGCM